MFLFPILFNHGWSTGQPPLPYRRPPQLVRIRLTYSRTYIRNIGPDHKGRRVFRVRCRRREVDAKDATGICVEVEGGGGGIPWV